MQRTKRLQMSTKKMDVAWDFRHGIYDYLEGRCRADAQTEHQTVSIYGTDSYKYARPYRPHAGSLDPFTTEVDLTTCRSTPRLCTNTVITEVIHKYITCPHQAGAAGETQLAAADLKGVHQSISWP